MTTYWLGEVHALDDLGNPIHDEFVDGCVEIKERRGWGIFVPTAYAALGGEFGTGRGQRYRKQEDGRWLKIEG